MASYLYQYLVGGAVFVLGIALAWRTGQVATTPGKPRRRLVVLAGGFLFFAALHGLLLMWSV